jgi:hypothetical protein
VFITTNSRIYNPASTDSPGVVHEGQCRLSGRLWEAQRFQCSGFRTEFPGT